MDKSKLYSFLNKATIFIYHQREKIILKILASQANKNSSNKKVLDIGCGNGGILRDFIKYGALQDY